MNWLTIFVVPAICFPYLSALNLKSAKMCLKLPVHGPCGPVIVAYYFDHLENHCKVFNRTICADGENNFVSELKCQATCLHKHKPLCSLPPTPGHCYGRKSHWHFLETSNTCRLFPKDQCGANPNAFTSMKKCLDRCSYRKAAVGSTLHAQINQNPQLVRSKSVRSSFRKLISRS
ncbi:kunitz-type serine protease inhibitor bitisilin-3-like isoform X2 [Dermacentor silvarum]|uniref:kunitz-type serine protease inhibitor bitisilin-3-like isoform X2 n=1 Tax=Dermacentor silvarum TaxID=543639 RepID=UPI002101C951|nr:kunitz-type serine protease inhibitor bitisilin-3-like isoform X2 [Dermacentor silvarum]